MGEQDIENRSDRRNDPEVVEEVEKFLTETLERMGLDCDVDRFDEDGDVVFEIRGDEAGTVIGKKGATLDALQLLCNRVARRVRRDANASIVLDADGYRARREQSLIGMAKRLGEQAVRQGTVITLEPLPARERKVVHMALAEFPGVTTRSEGEGTERRLQIIPTPPRD